MSKLKMVAGAALAFGALTAQAQQKAGEVLFVKGEAARVAADGAAKPLARGDAVFEGDLLRTGRDAHLQLRMRDEAFLGLRPGSELRLDRYGEQVLLELTKGALRSITGAIGRRDRRDYRLETRQVILGIRGTDHELVQREGGSDAGTYDRVTEGGTFLQAGAGRVDLDPGQTGFVAPYAGAKPLRLERTPEFLLAVLPPAADHDGPLPRGLSIADARVPQLPEAARFDRPPLGGPLEPPGATVNGAGAGTRPGVTLPDIARPPLPGKGRRN